MIIITHPKFTVKYDKLIFPSTEGTVHKNINFICLYVLFFMCVYMYAK